jgi:hypothetical protein
MTSDTRSIQNITKTHGMLCNKNSDGILWWYTLEHDLDNQVCGHKNRIFDSLTFQK